MSNDWIYAEIIVALKFLICFCVWIEVWAIGELWLSPEFMGFVERTAKKINFFLDKSNKP